MKKQPHGFRTSAYKRFTNEGYYTEHWVTKCLLPYIPVDVDNIVDPAAGRGDILKVLFHAGKRTAAMDIDTGPFEKASLGVGCGIQQKDFFKISLGGHKGVNRRNGLIMNPPYGGDRVIFDGRKRTMADAFLRHGLDQNIRFVAALLRTDFNHSAGRTDLFRNGREDFPFAFEIVLTKRPVWDWWIEDKPIIIDPKTGKEKKKSPMHNFSWFCWDREWEGASTQYWMGPKDVDMSVEVDNGDDEGENE